MRNTVLMTGAAALLVLAGCGDDKNQQPDGQAVHDGGAASGKKKLKPPKPAAGLSFRLEPGGLPSGRPERGAFTRGTRLPDAEALKLLARLAAPAVKKSDVKDFALRGRSKPAPRRGATRQSVFPPPQKPRVPPVKAGEPLRVLRFSPEGKVPLAGNLSVTFSQPMVAVTSHADSVARGVPVRLTPAVQGTWRWVGSRTLLLEPGVRFAMATSFRVEVPASAASALGNKLGQAKLWSFSTPPPRVIRFFPSSNPNRRDTLLFASFDQKIDAAAVLRTITLRTGLLRGFALRLARPDEIAQNEQVARLARAAVAGRWLAFRATLTLPADTSFSVKIGPGTPSAEGPLKTDKEQRFTFRTYGPLKIKKHGCGWGGKCPPMRQLHVRFSNRLDADAFSPRKLKILPALPDHRLRISGNMLYINGRTRGRTTYKVTIPARITDIYGQQLGQAETLSFETTRANPKLHAPGRHLVALDPGGKKSLRIYSVNHASLDLRVYAVKPHHYSQFRSFLREGIRQKVPRMPPGTLRVQRKLRPQGLADALVESSIDLRPWLTRGRGQLIVLVSQDPLPEKPYRRQYVARWVQVTDLALDAFVDHGQLLAWVTRLADGVAVSGAKVTLGPDGQSATTGADGLATLPLPAASATDGRVLTARAGGDLVFLPDRRHWYGGGSPWIKRPPPGEFLRWYVFDDRKLYRPGEKVRLKGWVRHVNMGRAGGLRLPQRKTIRYRVLGARGNKLGAGSSTIGGLGGFDFGFQLPKNANLGRARVELSADFVQYTRGQKRRHSFRIEEFRRPEFEVKASASSGPHLVGGEAQFSARARYFAGGGLPGARVRWSVSAASGSFVPPNLGGYTFVGWAPSWHSYRPHVRSTYKNFAGRTDSKGTHRVRIHFDEVDPPRPMSVSARATVQDVNRRSWSTNTSLLVHPARHYVGLKTKRYFVRQGQALEVKAVVADLDGKRVSGSPITMVAARLDGRWEGGRHVQREKDPQTCKVTSASADVGCSFKTPVGGTYLIRATIVDPGGRKNRTEMTRWVSGGSARPRQRTVAMERVRLVADRDSYQPGETAEILVVPPFSPAQGLMTIRRAGIAHKQRFSLGQGGSMVLRVPIKAHHLAGLALQVDLVGSAPRLDDQGNPVANAPRRPAQASGSLVLSVPPLKRKLTVQVKPGSAKLEPGGKTTISVVLRDADQKPVPDGEVALVVVDEAVLALTGYKLFDPLSTFYPYRGPGVRDHHMRQFVALAEIKDLHKQLTRAPQSRHSIVDQAIVGLANDPAPAPPTDEASRGRHLGEEGRMGRRSKKPGSSRGPAPIALRKDFSPLALFSPAVRTNAGGEATVDFSLPDNLTRYRVWAVAVAQERFYGKGEATITARLPLMVRPSAPRFLNFGDRFELPVVVQNQTDSAMAVQVAVRGTNVELTAGLGRKLTVPANDRLELLFPAAALSPGTARFQIAAVSGRFADAAEVSLPVWTPATTEAFATHGALDRGATVQPVKMPPGVVPSFGGLDITTSSTQLQALTDAVLYLVSYRFECSEQLSSRLLAVAALKDVLAAFSAPGLPSEEKILAAVKRDVTRLSRLQNRDGGYGFWRQGERSWPFLSIHVTHALVRARDKGFVVPPRMLSRALRLLSRIESIIPRWYGAATRRAIIAYSLYVRALAKDVDVAKAKRIFAQLIKDRQDAPLEAVAWLYPVLSGRAPAQVAELRKLLQNRVSETAATAQFSTSYGDDGYLILHSNRRVDTLLLEGLIVDQPKSDLIVKLVRGLLGHRKRGRWGNTQENAWVLLALDRYFRTYEKVTPNFVARAWLGDRFAGQHAFRGRSTKRQQIHVPMQQLAALKAADLVLAKQGAGRLYYRVGLRYAPADLKPPAASHGFTVRRRYEAVDKKSDVTSAPDGSWRVKAGARVRVTLTMVAPARRYHVALTDPLPAGLEPINAGLSGAEQTPGRTGPVRPSRRGRPGRWHRGWRRTWYEHQNMRDERVEAFTSLLWPGVHSYSYVARATTPGTFVVPPPRAEEMYHPETFGRGGGDRLVVE